MPANFVGALFVISSVWMFVVTVAAITKFSLWHLLLIGVSGVVALIGIGLIKLNYHAWLIGTVGNVIGIVAGFGRIFMNFAKGDGHAVPEVAARLGWPLLIAFLLYRSRPACRGKLRMPELLMGVKRNFAPLMAVAVTVSTLLVAVFHGSGGMLLLLGLPLLAIEFGVVYLVGSSIHRRCGWS